MKRYIVLLMTLVLMLSSETVMAAGENMNVPEDVYEWVQSTPRASYYFNKQEMCYGVDVLGNIELNTLIVPTIKLYDDVKKEDVIAKKRWRGGTYHEDMDAYNDLVGAAEYLTFDLAKNTVRVAEHDDIDSTWTTIAKDKTKTDEIDIASLSDKQVDSIFYKAILSYADKHQDELIARTKGTLTEADKKLLEAKKNPPKDDKHKKKNKKKK